MAHRRISFILAALMALLIIPFGAVSPALAATDYSNIRVLLSIGSGVQSFGMSVSGSYFIQENGVSFSGGTLTAQYSGGKVVLTHSSQGQIYSGSSVNIMRERIDPSAGYIRATVGGAVRSYLGHFMIKTSGTGLRVVNTVPLPHYLYGVVRGEMGNSFPLEALKAQAIAAKSYVLAGITGGSDYDIGDTAEDQVYKGYSASETMVIAAVDATYDIGLYLGSNILRAYYAASNGGSTLLPSDVWTGTNRYLWDAAYARTNDPYDVANPLTPQETILLPYDGDSSMNSSVSSRLRTAISSALSAAGYPNISVQRINKIYGFDKTSTYNASLSLEITLSNGQTTTLKCNVDMRALMSNAQRNSMRLFIVTETSQGYQVFQGRYGHGVGMSQRGAEQMANQGMRYDQILNFYYPGAALRSMGVSAPADPVKPSGSQSGSGTTNNAQIVATAVTTGSVNFRTGPSTSTASLGTIPKGTSLNIYGTSGEFSIAQYNNQTGYVHNSFLTITPVSSSQDTTPPADTGTPLGAGAKGSVRTETYMRSSANGSSSIIAKLLANVVLDLLSESGNYYYAHVQGYQGYVSKSDVNVTNAGTTGSSGSSAAGNFTATGVTTGNVNFRKGAGTNTSIIKQLAKGTTVNIYSKANGWYHVNVSGTDGYISATYVKETGSVSNTDTSGGTSTGTTVTAYGVTTGNVNFRKGPGTNNAVIRMLAKNTALEIYSKANGWYHVNVGGTEGYVSAAYVKETSAPSSSSSSSASSSARTGETTAQVNFRKSASSNSTLIKKLAKGTTFTIYSLSGNWYYVNVDGTDGYLHKDYVKETTSTSGSSGTSSSSGSGFSAVIINDWVWLRSTPEVKGDNSNALEQVAVGTNITVHSQNGSFYKATVNGVVGYVHKDYVRIIAAN